MGHTMGGDRAGVKTSRISHVASPIDRGITVQQLPVVARAGHADTITGAGNRSEVTYTQYLIVLVLGFSEEEDHRVGRITKVNPLKTGPVVIELVQSRFLSVEPVKVLYEA